MSSHEINSHKIHSHKVSSNKINSHDVNFPQDQLPWRQLPMRSTSLEINSHDVNFHKVNTICISSFNASCSACVIGGQYWVVLLRSMVQGYHSASVENTQRHLMLWREGKGKWNVSSCQEPIAGLVTWAARGLTTELCMNTGQPPAT